MEYPGTPSSAPVMVARSARDLLGAVRPKQWTKNLLVYLALFFTVNEAWSFEEAGDFLTLFGKTTLAFLVFSAVSGAVYLVNDLVDAEQDRRHPTKRLRPIASGRLSAGVAGATAALLAAAGLASGFALEPGFGLVVAIYVGVMAAYTLLIKRLMILDVMTISAGFVLRAVAGAVVLQVPVSPWLYTCTGVGALMIALAKRRSELAQAGEGAGVQRDILQGYTKGLLDQLMTVMATCVLITYGLYTFTAPNLPPNKAMMLTIPFVVYGVFRYMYLVRLGDLGERPEDILISDVPLIVTIAAWLAAAATVLVLFRG